MVCNTELRNCSINGTFIVMGFLYVLAAIIVLALGKAQDSDIVYGICLGLIVFGVFFIVIGIVFCCMNKSSSPSLPDCDCDCLDENFCSCVDEKKTKMYRIPEHNAHLVRSDKKEVPPDYYVGTTDEYTISSRSPYQPNPEAKQEFSRHQQPVISRPLGQQQPTKPDVLLERKWQTNEWSPLTKRNQNIPEVQNNPESSWAYNPAFNRPREFRTRDPKVNSAPSPFQQLPSPTQSPNNRPKYQITGPRGEVPTISERRGKPYVEPIYQWKTPPPRQSPMEFPTGETSDSDGNISPRPLMKTYSNPMYNNTEESHHYAKPAVLPKNWTLARGSTPEKPDLIPIRRGLDSRLDQNASPTPSGYDSAGEEQPVHLNPNPSSLKSYLPPASNFSYYTTDCPQLYRHYNNPSPVPSSNLRRVASQSSLMYTPILGRPVPLVNGIDHDDNNYDLNVGTMRSMDMPSKFRREYFY